VAEPSDATRIIRCAEDAAGLDFLVVDDLLDAEGCDRLVTDYVVMAYARDQAARDPNWRNRVLFYRELWKGDPRGAYLARYALYEAIDRVAAFYGLSAPLYPDVLSLVGWPVGIGIWPPHADDERAEFAHRAFSAVLYLNEGFEGGDLYLPRQDILIRPMRGMFVSLPGGMSHQHGVIPVNQGLRITAASFLTFDPAKADTSLPAPTARPE
jgi:2OG-Fe(II) oxygenase superfamily